MNVNYGMSWLVRAMQIDTIKQVAVQVRTELEQYYGHEGLKALCLDASRVLRDRLNAAGCQSSVVQGTFQIDEPDPFACEDWDENDFDSPDTMEEAKYNPLHYWVECNGTVIDITADQFNDELTGDVMQPITIGTYTELERYVPQKRGYQ